MEPMPEPGGAEKAQAYSAILAASGDATLLAPAVEKVVEFQADEPSRRKILFIVTDGILDDAEQAQAAIAHLSPDTTWIKHINIGRDGTPACEGYEEIDSPFDLPRKLLALLAEHIRAL